MNHAPLAMKRAGFFPIIRWAGPYLRDMKLLLTLTIAATVIVLICQALIPLKVEHLLHEGEGPINDIYTLVALIVLQLIATYVSHRGGHHVATLASTALRNAIFEKMLKGKALRQDGLVRSSVVSRHTSDVDRISEALEKTIVEGAPALVRIAQSLIILTWIEPTTGIAMTIAAGAFLILRSIIGRSMLVVDRDRLDASSRVGETVDESITAAHVLAGLHLGTWQRTRFRKMTNRLAEKTELQGIKIAQLVVSANAAGLVGLTVVLINALGSDENTLAIVAASLLYIEGVVKGLEVLPAWVRAVQQGVVSTRRVDMILLGKDRIEVPHSEDAPGNLGLELSDVTFEFESGVTLSDINVKIPTDCIVGLVTPPGTEPDALLSLLSGDENPAVGRVLFDGLDVRMPGVNPNVWYVPVESVAFNASVLEQLSAVKPDITTANSLDLLAKVGLTHLLEIDGGLHDRLGPGSSRLSRAERQRLSLAIALLAKPEALLIGSLFALNDADTALPLINLIRDAHFKTTVMCIRHPEVAASVDIIAFAHQGGISIGTHKDLLAKEPAYTQLWEQRLNFEEVDLSVLGISEENIEGLHTRLVTERYSAGDAIYRQGEAADRIYFTIAGRIEISTTNPDGSNNRVAVMGPGNHIGDLRLTTGERRAENATALDDCVLRSLSREAISAGLTGLLDRTPTERRIVTALLRDGSCSAEELKQRLSDVEAEQIDSAIALLTNDGALRVSGDQLAVVQKRSVKAGSRDLLDRLGDF